MFGEVKKWLEFVKFSHTVFALPFALASMLIAARDNRGWPGARVFLLILVAMACARTCAMAFNRIVDRKFDKDNPRTSLRHLPAGGISLMSAWTLWGVSAVGLVAASYFLNPICFYLSPVALIVVCSYSLTKRFTDFTHVFLGIAIALAPVGAWLAVRGNFDFMPIREGFLVPLLLAVAVVFWLIGFDDSGLRIRSQARAAFVGRSLGAEERVARCIPGAHDHAASAGCARVALWFHRGIFHRHVVDHGGGAV
jgi:4-hydroxybenzoate polyprenyltransferase